MDKEAVVHIYNGIVLSHKKEHIWVSPNEVDDPRACYPGWIKSERERQISCISTYIWNLERWYWWTNFQGFNADEDIENRSVDTVREGDGGRNWQWHWNINATICKTDSQCEFAVCLRELQPGALWQSRCVGWRGRWEGVSRGRGTCVPTANSCWCMAEINTIL